MTGELVTVFENGHIILPEELMKTFSISEGDKLEVYAEDNSIVIKPVQQSKVEEFMKWMDESKEWAASVGYTEEDVAKIIKDARKERRNNENSN